MTHKPWLAAILNLIFPGIGYVYIGKRMFFGITVLILYASFYYNIFLVPSSASSEPLHPNEIVFFLAGILFHIGFSYDAYKDAEEAKRQES